VMFASSGEKLTDFDVFHPDRMASRILDLGDILTLIEQAERNFDAEQAADMASRLASGEGFTLEDFVEQLAMVRKLGPIGNLLGMLPGAAQNREALSQISDKDLDRAAAIVNSMTVEERRNPKIINGSRRARIAKGSGVAVGEVSSLIVRFLEGQKMMRQMMGSMPGMGNMRRGQKSKGKGKKSKGKGGGRPAGRQALGQGGLAQQAAAAGLGQQSGLDQQSGLGQQSGPGQQPGLGGDQQGGLPGFTAIPGRLDDLPLRLPDGRQGGTSLPPGLRGRPGKKGR
jgi:signal recognition particle subunit SRP54